MAPFHLYHTHCNLVVSARELKFAGEGGWWDSFRREEHISSCNLSAEYIAFDARESFWSASVCSMLRAPLPFPLLSLPLFSSFLPLQSFPPPSSTLDVGPLNPAKGRGVHQKTKLCIFQVGYFGVTLTCLVCTFRKRQWQYIQVFIKRKTTGYERVNS